MAIALQSAATNHNEILLPAGASVSTSPLATIAIGTLALLAIAWDDITKTPTTCADDSAQAGTANVWTSLTTKTHSGTGAAAPGTAGRMSIYGCVLTRSILTSNTVTLTLGGIPGQFRTALAAFTGYSGPITTNRVGAGETSDVQNTVSSATMTPTLATVDAVAFGAVFTAAGGGLDTVPSGIPVWTELTDGFAGGTTQAFESQHRLLATPETIKLSAAYGGATNAAGICAAVVMANPGIPNDFNPGSRWAAGNIAG